MRIRVPAIMVLCRQFLQRPIGSVLLLVPHGSSPAIDSVRSTFGFKGPPDPDLERDSDSHRPEILAVEEAPAATPTAQAVVASMVTGSSSDTRICRGIQSLSTE